MPTRLPSSGLAHFVSYCLLLVLAACGGGDGSSAGGDTAPAVDAPVIIASLLSFAPGQAPAELGLGSENVIAAVNVFDATGTTSITNATVTLNGTPLAYSAALEGHVRQVRISPGASIEMTVTVAGKRYNLSTRQYATFPQVTHPGEAATWQQSAVNSVAWNSTTSSDSVQLLGLIGARYDWPAGGFVDMSPAARAYSIPAHSLMPDQYVLLVGVSELVAITGAQAGSFMIKGAFAARRVTVSHSVSPPPPPTPSVTELQLEGIGATTAQIQGSTRQLVVRARYSNGSEVIVTGSVAWISSNPAVVSVSPAGVISGLAPGSAVITGTLGGQTVRVTVNVIVPVSTLPVGPLTNSVSLQVDHAHTGRATLGGPVAALPLQNRWTRTLNGVVSYPLVAAGRVFVTTNAPAIGNPGSYDSSLYALDVHTGDVLWGPVNVPGTYDWSGHAYDQGRVFVQKFNGVLRAYAATDGELLWSLQLPGVTSHAASTPVAVHGMVYVAAPGKVFAVDQVNGSVLWEANARAFGHSTPAITLDGLFVSSSSATRIDALTGALYWHFDGPGGSSGRTTVVGENRVFVRGAPADIYPQTGTRNILLDPVTGAAAGTFSGEYMPAVAGGRGYFLVDGRLSSVDLTTQAEQWSFMGDGPLVTPALIIDDLIAVGSGSGKVYLLGSDDGLERWSGMAGAALQAPDEWNYMFPITTLGIGDGYLLVPAGNTLTGWRMTPP